MAPPVYDQNRFPTRIEMLNLLITERNYHSDHPEQINTKFLYAAGALIGSLFLAIGFEGDINITIQGGDQVEARLLMLGMILIILGFFSIVRALLMHLKYHRNKRKSIERIINNHLLSSNYDSTKIMSFMHSTIQCIEPNSNTSVNDKETENASIDETQTDNPEDAQPAIKVDKVETTGSGANNDKHDKDPDMQSGENYLFTREPNYNNRLFFHDIWIVVGSGMVVAGILLVILIILINLK